MIKLDVCNYCDRCPNFEPEVVLRPRVEILHACFPVEFECEKKIVTTTGDTIVKCCNRDRCASIYEYMEGLGKC